MKNMTALELKHNIRVSTEMLGNDESALSDVLNYIRNLLKKKKMVEDDAFADLTGAWENDGKSVEEVVNEIRKARVSGKTRKLVDLD